MFNLSLRGRILLISGLLLAIALVTNALSLSRLRSQNSVTTEITETWLPAVSKAADININVVNYRKLEFNLLATQSTDEAKLVLEEMDSMMGNVMIYSKVLEPLLTTPELQKDFTEFQTAWEAYQADSEQFKAAMDQENARLAEEILQGSSEKNYKTCYEALKRLTDSSYMAAVSISEAAAKSFKTTFYALIGLVVFSILAGLGTSAWNIRVMQKALRQVADGLESSSSVVQGRAEELVGSSEKISGNSTSTAASLEEIVASMEELTATVRQNSLSSNQAAQLSVEGQETVQTGQQKISSLITVMSEISKNSTKIEEILTLIDDIAFQTNLLALNAAVEAARAGEQGKGFAVVADAVRALAQKSGEAAKEISGLIYEASEKSKQGVNLAADSEKSLNEIVSNVHRVSDLIQQVAQASHEQTQGIEQVNKALTVIDQSLQGVASSMGVVTGSSEDLRSQAVDLKGMMKNLLALVGPKKKNEQHNNAEETEASAA